MYSASYPVEQASCRLRIPEVVSNILSVGAPVQFFPVHNVHHTLFLLDHVQTFDFRDMVQLIHAGSHLQFVAVDCRRTCVGLCELFMWLC